MVMETATQTSAEQLAELLGSISVQQIRKAFPAHEALGRCHLIYSPDGVGHLRELASGMGPRLLCGPYGDVPGADHTCKRGEDAVHLATCEDCASEGLWRRNAAEDEREWLRFARAQLRALGSVLAELNGALR